MMWWHSWLITWMSPMMCKKTKVYFIWRKTFKKFQIFGLGRNWNLVGMKRMIWFGWTGRDRNIFPSAKPNMFFTWNIGLKDFNFFSFYWSKIKLFLDMIPGRISLYPSQESKNVFSEQFYKKNRKRTHIPVSYNIFYMIWYTWTLNRSWNSISWPVPARDKNL